jgi:thiol-disulfide isomerase/thioredoxin
LQKNDTLYVLNFWATWCRPCIEELPYFEKCGSEFRQKKIKIVLVNVDFHNHVDKSVIPFMEEKKIRSTVIHITDKDSNEWISKADNSWTGAIPATIFYLNGSKDYFYEGAMTESQLRALILGRMKGEE